MIEYQRDIPADSSPAAVAAERRHVRDHLAAIAAADDNPRRYADQVRVWTARHPEDPALLRIEGALDAEPSAPYLRPGYDPLAGVDPDLYAAEVGAALLDEGVLRGSL